MQKSFIFHNVTLKGFWLTQWKREHREGKPSNTTQRATESQIKGWMDETVRTWLLHTCMTLMYVEVFLCLTSLSLSLQIKPSWRPCWMLCVTSWEVDGCPHHTVSRHHLTSTHTHYKPLCTHTAASTFLSCRKRKQHVLPMLCRTMLDIMNKCLQLNMLVHINDTKQGTVTL